MVPIQEATLQSAAAYQPAGLEGDCDSWGRAIKIIFENFNCCRPRHTYCLLALSGFVDGVDTARIENTFKCYWKLLDRVSRSIWQNISHL